MVFERTGPGGNGSISATVGRRRIQQGDSLGSSGEQPGVNGGFVDHPAMRKIRLRIQVTSRNAASGAFFFLFFSPEMLTWILDVLELDAQGCEIRAKRDQAGAAAVAPFDAHIGSDLLRRSGGAPLCLFSRL